jgi:hypothetical protein
MRLTIGIGDENPGIADLHESPPRLGFEFVEILLGKESNWRL